MPCSLSVLVIQVGDDTVALLNRDGSEGRQGVAHTVGCGPSSVPRVVQQGLYQTAEPKNDPNRLFHPRAGVGSGIQGDGRPCAAVEESLICPRGLRTSSMPVRLSSPSN